MENYTIREFYGEEVIDFKKLCTILFRYKNELLDDEEAYKKKLIEEDNNRNKDFCRLGAFYEGKLYAAIESHAFNTNFDTVPCKMSGIGGVVSDFNSPIRGAMKEIYKRSFEIMREKGQYISHLYPFEENYYRQFGYEVSCQQTTWIIPIEKLGIYQNGVVKPYDGTEKMQNDIKMIFNVFSKDKNLMMTKDEKEWKKFFDGRKPYVSGVNAYVHYTEEGVADSYMTYSVVPQEDKPQNMSVGTLWFTDLCAVREILAYFKTQRSYCDCVLVTLPETIDISPIIDSQGGWGKRNAERIVTNRGTSRVVDVEKVLEMAKYKGNGKICIKVYDDTYAPWNNDCYTVEFGEKTIVTRGGTPDIEMKITSFSSAILGRFEAYNLAVFPDVKINNSENLDKVFYKKHLWTEGHF